LISIALAELDDASDVLREGHVHKDARDEILFGTSNSSNAFGTSSTSFRNSQLDQAIARANRAIGLMRI
jgi:hypothetical protein